MKEFAQPIKDETTKKIVVRTVFFLIALSVSQVLLFYYCVNKLSVNNLPVSKIVESEAFEKSKKRKVPTAITTYQKISVPVTSSIDLTVYKRESKNATHNILFVHGAASGAWAWEMFFERMPSKFNLYAVNWRGHFDSSPTSNAWADDYIEDQEAVAEAIKKRNNFPLHLVAHGYGAATSAFQSARAQKSFRSLSLLSPVVPLNFNKIQQLMMPLVSKYRSAGSMQSTNRLDATFGEMFIGKPILMDYFRRYADKDYSTEKVGLIRDNGLSQAWQKNLRHAYRTVWRKNIPTAIYVAKYDNVIETDLQKAIAVVFGFKIYEFESGHYLPLDIEAEAVIKQVVEFISQIRS